MIFEPFQTLGCRDSEHRRRRLPPRPQAVAFEEVDQALEDALAGDAAGYVAASVADGLLGGVGGIAGA